MDACAEDALLGGVQQEASRRTQAGKPHLTELVSLCQVPFLLTPKAKAHVLQIEAWMQKQSSVNASSLRVRLQPQHASAQGGTCLTLPSRNDCLRQFELGEHAARGRVR